MFTSPIRSCSLAGECFSTKSASFSLSFSSASFFDSCWKLLSLSFSLFSSSTRRSSSSLHVNASRSVSAFPSILGLGRLNRLNGRF